MEVVLELRQLPQGRVSAQGRISAGQALRGLQAQQVIEALTGMAHPGQGLPGSSSRSRIISLRVQPDAGSSGKGAHIRSVSPPALRLPAAGAAQLGWVEVQVQVRLAALSDSSTAATASTAPGQAGALTVHGSRPEGSRPAATPPDGSAPPFVLVARGSWGNCLPVKVEAVQAVPSGGKRAMWAIKVGWLRRENRCAQPGCVSSRCRRAFFFIPAMHHAAPEGTGNEAGPFLDQGKPHATFRPCRPVWT